MGVKANFNVNGFTRYTLEAELGIIPNGISEPDYLGWEIKQYGVNDFSTFRAKGPITLMTPEPTMGEYRDEGLEFFLHRYGYKDTRGVEDRINFGGVYKINADFHKLTGLRLELSGYDQYRHRVTDLDGGICLVSRENHLAAKWPFGGMLSHWNRKHAKAAYVPSLAKSSPPEYSYGSKILMCEKTDFLRFIKAVSEGRIYYDPGIKMENASSGKPKFHRRSQFRIKMPNLSALYENSSFEGMV